MLVRDPERSPGYPSRVEDPFPPPNYLSPTPYSRDHKRKPEISSSSTILSVTSAHARLMSVSRKEKKITRRTLTHCHSYAPTLGSPTRICANVACQGARAPTPGPPGPALAGAPCSSLAVALEGPYGFGNEFWRWWWWAWVLIPPGDGADSEPESDVADPIAAC